MAIIIILAASIVTHLLYFGHPSSVIFDEVHYGNFISNYWHGTYFFDVSPPLAKLIFVVFGYLIGADHDLIDWSTIGNQLTPHMIALRLVPMIAGIILPIIIYYICRHLNLSKIASTVAAFLIIFENSLLVQSRVIVVDIIMLVFGFSAILAYLASTRMERRKRYIYIFFSAILAASAFGIKWNGLSFAFLIILMELFRQYRENKNNISEIWERTAKIAFIYIGVAGIIYMTLFAIHFTLLPYSGPGDSFMSQEFQQTLARSPEGLKSVIPQSFGRKFLELNERMFMASATLNTAHSYSSKWYTWPLMIRPIFYWQGVYDEQTSTNSYIYLIGNPIIYWFGTAVMISLLLFSILALSRKARFEIKIDNKSALFFVLVGYAANFLPYILIGRVMFLYHYEAALIMSIIGIALLLDTMAPRQKKIATCTLATIVFAVFVYMSPLTYGTPLSDGALQARIWLSTWR